jgi:PAS domain S-box-containing protein
MNISEINVLSAEQIADERQKALHEERNYFVFTHKSADGEERIVEVHSSPILFKEKPVLFSIIHDITGRKKAEVALKENVQRLELAQNVAKAGIWDWDVVSGQLEWSRQMFNLFGLDKQKTMASFEAWRSALHPEDLEIASRRIDTALKARMQLNSDYRILLPDGQTRWINAVGKGEYDIQGRPVRMIGVCIDITERKQAEEFLQQKAKELRASNVELEQFNRAAVGRELRMVELKEEIDALCRRLGEAPRYGTTHLEADRVPGVGATPAVPGGGGS